MRFLLLLSLVSCASRAPKSCQIETHKKDYVTKTVEIRCYQDTTVYYEFAEK